MRKLLMFFAVTCALLAQKPAAGPTVLPSDGPAKDLFAHYFYVSGNYTYHCYSASPNITATLPVTAVTNATAAVVTSTAHGIHLSASPRITFSGGTGNWTFLNGTFTATMLSADTFSIPLNTTALGALTGTIVATTESPRITSSMWAVQRVEIVSGTPVSILWGASGWGNICANYATLSYQ